MKCNVLVTGGAGFIGSNLAASLLYDGHYVTVLDALLRCGSKHNIAWLHELDRRGRLKFIDADVRDFEAVRVAAEDADVIYDIIWRRR
jgi:CDP-paratose 2-epimerase